MKEKCENQDEIKKQCNCNKNCNCENCQCEDCQCENCNCGEECECDETKCCKNNLDGEETCGCKQTEENKNYLTDLLRVQAEFDNYRKRMTTALGDARQDGFMDAIEQFLPALDSFKMATAMITDKNTLLGIQFIEKGILDTLSKMGVEQISATGEFNPEFHHAIDTGNEEGFKTNEIIKEVYKGFTYKGKVIRYSQVVVQK